MKILLQKLQKKWSIRVLNRDSASDLQSFLDLFEDFFHLCEGMPGSGESLLTDCPPSKNLKEDKFVLGIYDREELIGLIDTIRDYPEDQTWTIGYLLIHPKSRNQRIGHRLLEDLEQAVKSCGVRKLRCVVQPQNPKALRFWQKCGFDIVGQGEECQVNIVNHVDILEKIL